MHTNGPLRNHCVAINAPSGGTRKLETPLMEFRRENMAAFDEVGVVISRTTRPVIGPVDPKIFDTLTSAMNVDASRANSMEVYATAVPNMLKKRAPMMCDVLSMTRPVIHVPRHPVMDVDVR